MTTPSTPPSDPTEPAPGGIRRITLDAATSRTLLTELPAATRAGPEDVLLAALVLALGVVSPGERVVELEGHGREPVGDADDLHRTVGWFTSLYPVLLAGEPVDPAGGELGPAVADRALGQVKELRRQIPDQGVGYGLLRHLDPQSGPLLAAGTPPSIRLNYLGRFTGQAPGETADPADWQLLEADPDEEPAGAGGAPATGCPVELNAVAWDSGPDTVLEAVWSWSGEGGSPDAARLADAWRWAAEGLARLARAGALGGPAPADFAYVDLDQHELDELGAEL